MKKLLMFRLATIVNINFAISFLCVIASTCSAFVASEKALPPNYWELTRSSDIVLKGNITNVNADVTLAVSDVFKGKDVQETVEFAAPPVPKAQPCIIICGGPRILRFIAGKACIVFLHENKAGGYSLVDAAIGNLAVVEQSVRDVLRFDALSNDRNKCKMLVSLVSPHEGLRSGCALRELYKYNKPEFLELLAPLADDSVLKVSYIDLLGKNANPAATNKLKVFLRKTEQKNILLKVISVLQRKDPKDTELSKELLRYITHDEPEVRRNVIFALKYREYKDATPEIVKCLDDEAPVVRSYALYFIRRVQKSPDILAKINKLTHDPDENVRAAAYDALPRQVSSFYRLLYRSLLDKSSKVRHTAARLDLLWESRPLAISLLLLWPCIILTGLVIYAARGIRWSWRIQIVLMGIAAGYIGGAVAGYLIGLYHITNPIFHSFILIPPVFMPIGILLSGAISRYGRKAPVIIFCLFTTAVCVVIRIVTLSNTLWPCVLTGFFLLGVIIPLPVLRQPIADQHKSSKSMSFI